MARPRSKELTARELEVMHAVWDLAPNRPEGLTVAEIRDELARRGRDLAYTTVATLFRILGEKEFLSQINEERPFRYEPARSFEEVSGSLLGDLIDRVFGGSREQLLLRLIEDRALSAKERRRLEELLKGDRP